MRLFDSIYNPPEQNSGKNKTGGSNTQSAPKRIWDVLIHHISQLIELNILVVLTSLPIITVPIAWFAATKICLALLQGRVVYIWHDYWRYVRNVWKPALYLGITNTCLLSCAGIGAFFYGKGGHPLGITLSWICLIISIALLLQFVYLPALSIMTSQTFKQQWLNAMLLVAVQFKKTLATAAFDLFIILIGVGFLPYSFFIMPLIGVSLLILANTECARRGVATYVFK